MKKLICYILCLSFIFSSFSTLIVNADNSDVDKLIRDHIINSPSEIEYDDFYAEKLLYDENGNITGRIVTTSNEKKKYTYEYNSDGTFTEHIESLEPDITIQDIGSASLFSADDPDLLITTPELISQIQGYKAVWEQADKSSDLSEAEKTAIKTEVHIQAQLARADYCVMYPDSSFAKAFMPDGRMNSPINAFRRTIDPTMENEYATDVMVLQRLLLLYGYLDEGDISSTDYGYYTKTTQDAVKEYTKKELNSPTDIVGKNVIGKLFNASNEWQTSKRTYDNLRGIGLFNAKHNLVCWSLAFQLQTTGTVYREGYLHGAGVNGAGGRFDVAFNTGTIKYVWEVKPDTPYGHSIRSINQLQSYIIHSNDDINKLEHPEYCPLIAGFDIAEKTIAWNTTENIQYSSFPQRGAYQRGMVFYRTSKNGKTVLVPDKVEEKATEKVKEREKEYGKITLPAPEPVRNGLVANNVDYTGLFVVGGICVILILASGQYWALGFAVI